MAAESAVAAEVRHTALGANNQLRSPVLSSRGLNVESRAILLQAEPWLMTDQSVTRLLGEVHSLRERAVMYAVLSELRPKNRANVVYFSTDGRPYSNRDVFRRTAWQEQRPSLGADDCGSGAVGTTYYCGYFHRRYSDNTRGSSEIKFTSNLPCTSTNIETPRNESTYLMGGSRTLDSSGNPIALSDVGLQYTDKSPPLGETFSIQNFMKETNQTGGQSGGAGHFDCDQTGAIIDSYDVSTTELGLSTTGVTVEAGLTTLTTVLPIPATPPSSPTCEAKRFTSTVKPAATMYPDGSYFGVNSPLLSPSPTIAWSNVLRGPTGHLNHWAEFESEDCPSTAPGVIYTVTNAYTETVGINAALGGSSSPTVSCNVVQTHA